MNTLPRRVTVYLAAPPGDGLRTAREHFIEYIKPVLVAGALSWDVVEGRREGDIRAGLAEKVRRVRRKRGEKSVVEEPKDLQAAMEALRQHTKVQELDGTRGDVVVGRHTWKEYVRGLHEGFLGPMDPPEPPIPPPAQSSSADVDELGSPSLADADVPATPDSDLMTTPNAEPLATSEPEKSSSSAGNGQEEEKKKEEPPPEPPKPLVTPPYNTTSSYAESQLPSSMPPELDPSTTIPFPHILGFLKTPIRMYWFLNRRSVADEIGRQTAAAVLAAHRQYREPSVSASMDGSGENATWEQTRLLEEEEQSWNKATRDRTNDEAGQERVWLDDMVLDQRVAERMRRFEVTPEDEDRARRIAQGAAGIPGHVQETRSDYGAE